ncbi:glycosyl transferase family 2 [Helicobacter aurati]|uniref:Glycosyl transferase family 2 n=2 Tax=Helicobacter aurati TaxID=137778 RepID=A0A3D8J2I5_9HELI|nr:glycosyl transferase family 2 [Helicobacter aurati]
MFRKTQDEIMSHWHIGLETSQEISLTHNHQHNIPHTQHNDSEVATKQTYNPQQTTTKPLCSFLCITYNHVEFIEQCLIGFLEQETTFPFEIIIHDDCSTDGTQRIIQEYQAKYPKIIKALYEEENQYSKGSKGKPFWALMHKMAGKYIALCEGDDYWNDPKKIQTQVAFLESHSEFVGCYHRCHTLDSSGVQEDNGSNHRDTTAAMLQFLQTTISTRTVCYRNVIDYLEPNLLFYSSKITNGDTFLWTLLGQHGDMKYIDSIEPAYYRLHSGGVWSPLSAKSRFQIHAKSFYYMSEYYSQANNPFAASFFLQLSLQNLCAASDANLTQKEVDSVIKSLLIKRGGGGNYPLGGFQATSVKLILRLFFPRTHFFIIRLRDKFRLYRQRKAIA